MDVAKKLSARWKSTLSRRPDPGSAPQGDLLPAASATNGRAAVEESAAPDPVSEADRLVDEGRLVAAVDLLAKADQSRRDPEIEMRLVDLRHQAARSFEPGPGRTPWPPVYHDPFPEVAGRLPEIQAADLGPLVLGGAVAHHGCVVVRNLFTDAQTKRTVEAIDRTLALAESTELDPVGSESPSAWYRPFQPVSHLQKVLRQGVAEQGGRWLADSPAATAQVLDDLTSSGAIDAISAHLGERLFFSMEKSTLRRAAPVYRLTGWHQDGAFLGPEVRTMNVWVSLSHCGGNRPAPGMAVVPKRLEQILPTDDGPTRNTIGPQRLTEASADAPVIQPEFDPGDAMLFDERFLHSTYLTPEMTEPRYALECWFFAPSHASPRYLPFLV